MALETDDDPYDSVDRDGQGGCVAIETEDVEGLDVLGVRFKMDVEEDDLGEVVTVDEEEEEESSSSAEDNGTKVKAKRVK